MPEIGTMAVKVKVEVTCINQSRTTRYLDFQWHQFVSTVSPITEEITSKMKPLVSCLTISILSLLTPTWAVNIVHLRGTSVYIFDNDTTATFEETVKWCEKLGGHPPSITSQEDLDFLANITSLPTWLNMKRDSETNCTWLDNSSTNFSLPWAVDSCDNSTFDYCDSSCCGLVGQANFTNVTMESCSANYSAICVAQSDTEVTATYYYSDKKASFLKLKNGPYVFYNGLTKVEITDGYIYQHFQQMIDWLVNRVKKDKPILERYSYTKALRLLGNWTEEYLDKFNELDSIISDLRYESKVFKMAFFIQLAIISVVVVTFYSTSGQSETSVSNGISNHVKRKC
jgi:hypothetical protein